MRHALSRTHDGPADARRRTSHKFVLTRLPRMLAGFRHAGRARRARAVPRGWTSDAACFAARQSIDMSADSSHARRFGSI
jgi:hypothetical protein